MCGRHGTSSQQDATEQKGEGGSLREEGPGAWTPGSEGGGAGGSGPPGLKGEGLMAWTPGLRGEGMGAWTPGSEGGRAGGSGPPGLKEEGLGAPDPWVISWEGSRASEHSLRLGEVQGALSSPGHSCLPAGGHGLWGQGLWPGLWPPVLVTWSGLSPICACLPPAVTVLLL